MENPWRGTCLLGSSLILLGISGRQQQNHLQWWWLFVSPIWKCPVPAGGVGDLASPHSKGIR